MSLIITKLFLTRIPYCLAMTDSSLIYTFMLRFSLENPKFSDFHWTVNHAIALGTRGSQVECFRLSSSLLMLLFFFSILALEKMYTCPLNH